MNAVNNWVLIVMILSPVVKPSTIHIVLSSAVSTNWPIHQLEMKNAFPNGHLSEKFIYINHFAL